MVENGKNILVLNLHKKWFDMIKSGEKKEEYRSGRYWYRRLVKQDIKYDIVEFRNGYNKNSLRFRTELIDIVYGEGNPEWGAPRCHVFILKLGKML